MSDGPGNDIRTPVKVRQVEVMNSAVRPPIRASEATSGVF